MNTIIIGAFVSLLVQWLKSVTNLGEYKTLAVVLLVSLVAAGVYTALVAAGYWETVASVLVLAGAFYTFIIARFHA